MTNRMNDRAKPFIKWVGGKSRILDSLITSLPKNYNNYFEPFVGGGALFFAVQPKNATLSDANYELINTYLIIKNDVKNLIINLKKHENTEVYYYHIRNLDRTEHFNKLTAIERASRFLFLNRTCFNGMYRVSQKNNYFNVPYGRYRNPKICDEETLLNCHEALQSVNIICQDFKEIRNKITNYDFVYFDPPYAETFTGYTKECFRNNMQIKLREMCDELTNAKVYWMLSNSDTDFVKEQYKKYNIKTVENNSTMGGKNSKRKKISELIITNY